MPEPREPSRCACRRLAEEQQTIDMLPSQARFIKCIFELLNSGSHSVKYEAASTLTTLTQNPAAVKGEH